MKAAQNQLLQNWKPQQQCRIRSTIFLTNSKVICGAFSLAVNRARNRSEKLDEMRDTIDDVKEEDEPGTARKVFFNNLLLL